MPYSYLPASSSPALHAPRRTPQPTARPCPPASHRSDPTQTNRRRPRGPICPHSAAQRAKPLHSTMQSLPTHSLRPWSPSAASTRSTSNSDTSPPTRAASSHSCLSAARQSPSPRPQSPPPASRRNLPRFQTAHPPCAPVRDSLPARAPCRQSTSTTNRDNSDRRKSQSPLPAPRPSPRSPRLSSSPTAP